MLATAFQTVRALSIRVPIEDVQPQLERLQTAPDLPVIVTSCMASQIRTLAEGLGMEHVTLQPFEPGYEPLPLGEESWIIHSLLLSACCQNVHPLRTRVESGQPMDQETRHENARERDRKDQQVTSARKLHFIAELKQLYTRAISDARSAETRAAGASDEIRQDGRRKEDAKESAEAGRLAAGHRRRRQRGTRELETLIAFAAGGVRDFRRQDAVGIGAFVDVSVEREDGREERTLFVLPVGAGRELTGPGGDGFVHVITPGSPVGKALLGTRIGDVIEVVIDGHDSEWEVLDLA